MVSNTSVWPVEHTATDPSMPQCDPTLSEAHSSVITRTHVGVYVSVRPGARCKEAPHLRRRISSGLRRLPQR